MVTIEKIECVRKVRRALHDAIRGVRSDGGASAVEFAFLAPILILLFAGICQFSLVLSNYLTLEHAVHAGVRTMGLSRGGATPFTDTRNAIFSSAGNLTTTNISLAYSVSGTACSSDTTCAAALQPGVPETISASYPCNLVVFGTNFYPSCTLTVSTTERVE
jgi:Flp pilus assembly protein TadG